jgi:anion-transporting  ArsA/GET3 family ATPase
MTSALERKLLVVTGKGGVGKTTLAAAIGMLAADAGLRTIVVEVGDQDRLPTLFGRSAQSAGAEIALSDGLWSISIDPDRALLEWLQALGGRMSGRVLASSGTFQYFAAAAPGAKELVSMVKIWELTQTKRWRGRGRGYDLVVLDAPATGHALGMLHSPRTFGAIARVGPIAGQAERVRELLEDPARSSYFTVAHATEMAVSETLEFQEDLHGELGRELHAVIVNCVLPQRFTSAELRRLTREGDISRRPAGAESAAAEQLRSSAISAARAVHERARVQHNLLARLRRRRLNVLPIPFQFSAEVDLAGVRRIADQLRRQL